MQVAPLPRRIVHDAIARKMCGDFGNIFVSANSKRGTNVKFRFVATSDSVVVPAEHTCKTGTSSRCPPDHRGAAPIFRNRPYASARPGQAREPPAPARVNLKPARGG